jgi:hypothetical protein
MRGNTFAFALASGAELEKLSVQMTKVPAQTGAYGLPNAAQR